MNVNMLPDAQLHAQTRSDLPVPTINKSVTERLWSLSSESVDGTRVAANVSCQLYVLVVVCEIFYFQ